MNESNPVKTPWHLWAAGLLGLLWNSYGGYDYFMSKTKGDAYLQSAGMTPAQIEHFHAMPVWMTAVWAVGVWGAMLGNVLLLARSRWAFEVFVASLLAYVLSLVYAYLISPMPDSNPSFMVIQGVILAGCLFFVWYAHTQRKTGVLR
jgi:Na+-translocating ferredoxin:NAD+ oxidoreductase RnfD subunit